MLVDAMQASVLTMLCQRRPQTGWMMMMILGLMQRRLAIVIVKHSILLGHLGQICSVPVTCLACRSLEDNQSNLLGVHQRRKEELQLLQR